MSSQAIGILAQWGRSLTSTPSQAEAYTLGQWLLVLSLGGLWVLLSLLALWASARRLQRWETTHVEEIGAQSVGGDQRRTAQAAFSLVIGFCSLLFGCVDGPMTLLPAGIGLYLGWLGLDSPFKGVAGLGMLLSGLGLINSGIGTLYALG